jgi:hypothetical protein
MPADIQEPERIEDSDKMPRTEEMRAYVDGLLEFVNCLYEGHFPTVMVVNDEGRLNDLPVNKRATEIYWAASATRGVDLSDKEQREADAKTFWEARGVDPEQVINIDPKPDDPPYIHGPAIVLEGIKVE